MLAAAETAGIERVLVVVGYRAELVKQTLAGWPRVEFIEQTEQLGTGHAVMVCRAALAGETGPVLIVTGDSPLLQVDSVRTLLAEYERQSPACIVGSTHKENPLGLGRIVRDEKQRFVGIVEQKDATPQQARITEVNMSTYVFHAPALLTALDQLTTDNAQREYYITDCPGILQRRGETVLALPVLKACEALSVNTVEELEIVAAEMRRSSAD